MFHRECSAIIILPDWRNVAHERLYQEIVVEEPGYFRIYLSNGSQEASVAFFDDFNMQLSESPFIQGTLYYSYGMIAMQEVREGGGNAPTVPDQGLDKKTGWYDFHARQYAPALGRCLSIDPRANSRVVISQWVTIRK